VGRHYPKFLQVLLIPLEGNEEKREKGNFDLVAIFKTLEEKNEGWLKIFLT